ncbi:MAG: LLM class F420-dependent oxidoreductase [Caulobacteraceae bacterium]|nr:LLM class F420-dependent oxidoreductase [Caulobacteraceae bacterium]
MKLSLSLGPRGRDVTPPMELILLAERLGYDAVWTAETYGADAMTPLAYIAALTKKIKLGTSIAQIDARTPANLAMCAQTIDALAGGGRMRVGIGTSGPQIVEGWLGRPWGRTNYRLRDTVAILRKIWRREYVEHHGKEIELPYRGPGSIGLGKPLKNIMHPGPIPIYIGADTPLNVRMTGEVADGLMAMHLTPSTMKQTMATLQEGIAKRTDGMTLEKFYIRGGVGVRITDDVKAALAAEKAHIALYAGGMGARSINFHKEAMVKRGFGEAADRIQELFLAGRKEEAAAAVPDEYVDEEYLVGPQARIAERYKAWRDSGLSELAIRMAPPEVIELMAKIASK